MIDAARAKLRYDPETGELHWRASGARAGTAPTVTRLYRRVQVDGCEVLEHVLIWAMQTGEWPANEVDHKNRCKTDNRWCNLQAATRGQNQHNTALYKSNSTGFRGVTYCKRRRRWAANARINGRNKWLGYHDSPEAAHAAYLTVRLAPRGVD